jgi:UDP-glucose 4-epimerase
MSHVLVTGANGFVGRALCRTLMAGGHHVTGLVRRPQQLEEGVTQWVDPTADFSTIDTGWSAGLNVDSVVHLASRVHVMRDNAADPDAAFCATNVDGALRVAEAASRHGVRRFVFVSSVKALAEADAGRPLREDDTPAPQDAYGRSKLAAEQALTDYARESGLEMVIVRPPLIYGPRVRANFLSLMDGVWKGIPLPLGRVDARRSVIFVDNLADALMHCATDSRASNQCFHVADSDAPTVPELVRALAHHLQRPSRLLSVPPCVLLAIGKLVGRSAQVDRLVGALELDTSRIRAQLGWQPPYSTDQGLAETARWYRSTHGGPTS